MYQSGSNKFLVFAGVFTSLVALLHVAVILGGPAWYRFFGVDEQLVAMAEQGSPTPAMLTGVIAIILFICACYALSGAGIIRKLPLLKLALFVITSVYLGLGSVLPYYQITAPHLLTPFIIWGASLCFIGGFGHLIGTIQIWEDIRYRPSQW